MLLVLKFVQRWFTVSVMLSILGFGPGPKWRWSQSVIFPEKVSLYIQIFLLFVPLLNILIIVILVKVFTVGPVHVCVLFSVLYSSRQRISSRSIQEKMERLAQAAQVGKNILTALMQHVDITAPFCWLYCLYICVEVWHGAVSRRHPEDLVPAGWGVQEERPLWEGAAGSEPHQPGSFQTGTFVTHFFALCQMHTRHWMCALIS